MASEDRLRLAVLSALIRQHGPVPCIHVDVVRKFDKPRRTSSTTFEPAANGYTPPSFKQDSKSYYRCTASALKLHEGDVILDLRPLHEQMESGIYVTMGSVEDHRNATEVCKERDRLCASLGCLPWDRTSLGQPLTGEDARVALRHVEAGKDGVKILPKSTEEISAWTFDEKPDGVQKRDDGGR